MTASFARARARGAQLGLITHVPWEKRGRPALVKGDRCAMKSARNLSFAERETGLDKVEGEFSSGGPSNHGAGLTAYPLWLATFPYGLKAFRLAIGGGSRQRAK